MYQHNTAFPPHKIPAFHIRAPSMYVTTWGLRAHHALPWGIYSAFPSFSYPSPKLGSGWRPGILSVSICEVNFPYHTKPNIVVSSVYTLNHVSVALVLTAISSRKNWVLHVHACARAHVKHSMVLNKCSQITNKTRWSNPPLSCPGLT